MDRDTVFFHKGVGRPYLHCAHCGTILYGDKATEAVEAQKNAYDLKVVEAERLRKEQERIDKELAQQQKGRIQEKPKVATDLAIGTKIVATLIQKRNVGAATTTVVPFTRPHAASEPTHKPLDIPVAEKAVGQTLTARAVKAAVGDKQVVAKTVKPAKITKTKGSGQDALTASVVKAAVEAKKIVEPLPAGVRLIPCGNVTADQLTSDVVLNILKRGLNRS